MMFSTLEIIEKFSLVQILQRNTSDFGCCFSCPVYFFETPTKLFQNIVLNNENGTLRAHATHFCAQDVYASSYAFFPDGHFEITHVVRGPKKTYTSKTIFRKITQ